jgi:hypothetical protein
MRVLLFVLLTGAVIWALVECIQADDTEIRRLPKIWWILIILFFWAVGAVAWFVAGRPRGPGAASAPWPSGPTSGLPEYERRPRPVAPEDDPEFLRELRRSNSEHEQLLKRWEEDLKRRERDLGKRRDDKEPPEDRPRS